MTVAYRGPVFLESPAEWFGLPYFDRVTEIELHGKRYGDEALALIPQFSRLESISMINTDVTETGLESINRQLTARKIACRKQ